MPRPRLAQASQQLGELPVSVRSATSASSRDPACDTTPSPSAVAVILGLVVVSLHLESAPLPGGL
jgi:hypothetical protein